MKTQVRMSAGMAALLSITAFLVIGPWVVVGLCFILISLLEG